VDYGHEHSGVSPWSWYQDTVFLLFFPKGTLNDRLWRSCPNATSSTSFLGCVFDDIISRTGSQSPRPGPGSTTALLPANVEGKPTIGFIAHLDTSPEISGANVRARVLHFDGSDIPLNDTYPLSPSTFPNLLTYVGEDLVDSETPDCDC
jgi:tripeptide aminopeptidase